MASTESSAVRSGRVHDPWRSPRSVGATPVAAVPPGVAERIDATARKALPDWPQEVFAVRELPVDRGRGVNLMLEAAFESVTEVVSSFGKLGTSAFLGETVTPRSLGAMALIGLGLVAIDGRLGRELSPRRTVR